MSLIRNQCTDRSPSYMTGDMSLIPFQQTHILSLIPFQQKYIPYMTMDIYTPYIRALGTNGGHICTICKGIRTSTHIC